MWIVTSDYVKGGLTYFVENRMSGERRGQFDCEPWAREFANELNNPIKPNKTHVLLSTGCRAARDTLREFVDRNKKFIVSYDSDKLPYSVVTDDGETYYFMTPHYFSTWKKEHKNFDVVRMGDGKHEIVYV